MSGHPSSTGSPSISSSSVDPNLLSLPTNSTAVPPSAFYSKSTRNRPVTPPQNVFNPTTTPISNKTSGSYKYASEIHNRDSANYSLAQETSGLFLGAMPPKQFLDEFFPLSQDTPKCPNSKGAFASVSSAGKEVNIYAPFVNMFPVSVSAMLHQHSVDHGSDSIRPQIDVYRYTPQSRYRVR